MKSSKNYIIAAFLSTALTIVAAGQQSNTGTQQQNQKMQGMQGQGKQADNSQMMQNCRKNMHSVQQTNEKARQDIASARKSNDPSQMRTALEEADKALAGVSEHMQMCQGMMQQKHGMRGMMSSQQKDTGKETTQPKQ